MAFLLAQHLSQSKLPPSPISQQKFLDEPVSVNHKQ